MNRNEDRREPATPWWRVGMVWLVLGGPLTVVVAACVTAAIAWHDADPVVTSGAAPVASKIGR